jgi:hypothetical protein
MPLRIMHRGYYEIPGEGFVLLTAPHAGGPAADLLTGEITEAATLRAKCHALIGNTSRNTMDLNRTQAFETGFRQSIKGLVENDGIRLILDVHGKEDAGVDIGTANGETASNLTTNLVRASLAKNFAVVELNKEYAGLKHGSIITTHAKKDSQGHFLVEAVQLEFGFKERHFQKDKAVDSIVEIANLAKKRLGPFSNEASETNQA